MDTRPRLRFLDDATVIEVVEEAKRILEEVGVEIHHAAGREILADAGARVGNDGRVRIGAGIVDRALATTRSEVVFHDRGGGAPILAGGDTVSYNPGSAATQVLDYGESRARPATSEDCLRFAALTDRLPDLAFQSTCVVPSDVSVEIADRHRLCVALLSGRKPIVTGTFAEGSFEIMREMLVCVRGSDAALREKPLALFDCCPTSPLAWSDLSCASLIGCALAGIPAELISVPMTGATSPVTLLGALTQHTAENLSGVAIHQLAAPGAPLIYGACASAFDMRRGTSPMGAVESMMLNAAAAQVGKHLGLPTHAYMALSDSKSLDYQAGMESGGGALVAALAGINIVSGPGMLEFAGCQSLEKLVLDHEACALALRAARGMARRGESLALESMKEALPGGQFLKLDETRRWFREELRIPGAVVDRDLRDAWLASGSKRAADRAHEEVVRLLAATGPPPLEPAAVAALRRLMQA